MQNITTIYVVRHGESVANLEDMCGGDSQLTDKGREQAAQTKTLLADIHFDTAFSSDYVRAVDTAAIIYDQAIPLDHRLKSLRERDFGGFDGRPNEDWMKVKDAWEEQYRSLPFATRSHYDYADDIESDKVLCDRFMDGLHTIAAGYPGKTVLVASHAGPIRVMLMRLGFADYLTVGSFDNAGFVELVFDDANVSIKKTRGINKPSE